MPTETIERPAWRQTIGPSSIAEEAKALRRAFYDGRAAGRARELRRCYHRLLHDYYRRIVPTGQRVLELGCGLGDLVAAVQPSLGVGVDFSPEMLKCARERHPELEFHLAEAETFAEAGPYDYILLSDLVNDLYDVQQVLTHLIELAHPQTRLVINFFNHVWRPVLTAAAWFGAKSPAPPQNWLSTHDMAYLLELSRWQVIKQEARILWPINTPVWAAFCNRWLAPLLRHLCLTIIMVARPVEAWRRGSVRRVRSVERGMRQADAGSVSVGLGNANGSFPLTPALSLGERVDHPPLYRKSEPVGLTRGGRTMLPIGTKGTGRGGGEGSTRQPSALEAHQSAGPQSINPLIHKSSNGLQSAPPETEWDTAELVATDRHFSCSVVVPARNEAGNIEELVERLPELGLGTEIIFVEGGSDDSTWEEIQRVARLYPHRDIKILKQTGRGKGQAVRQGFAAATGDVLFILDADLSVAPEELLKFYEVARAGGGEFINGVRSVYPMEHGAMRYVNMVGNKFFSLAFSFLLGQPIKDTLCGTKVLFRREYERIARNRSVFGDFDPFGDFDLLFGAAKLNLRIVDLPIHYQARTYGQTNIQRWRHGWLLLRMVWFAAQRLKFV